MKLVDIKAFGKKKNVSGSFGAKQALQNCPKLGEEEELKSLAGHGVWMAPQKY